jgi:glycosyltransferase involved in cell wall biosynthesis
MLSPDISELPAPPAGRTGWPWTEASEPLPPSMADGRPWPRVTVITPSFNQAGFIEATLRSVLLQGYPNLEYLVLDGGSTDGSVEIIERYAPWIDFWTSEPDGGQSAAINRGLEMGTGEFAAWINSDDMLFKGGLREHALRVGFDGGKVYVGLCAYMDEEGKLRRLHRGKIHSLEDLLRIPEIWRKQGNIVQPEVLFPRRLALEVGGLNPDNHYSMDYELWGNFFLAGLEFQYTEIPFGILRRRRGQKSADGLRTTDALIPAALRLLERAQGLSNEKRNSLRESLLAYQAGYPEAHWKNSGRLARWGIPRPLVTAIRSVREKLEQAFAYRAPKAGD